MSEKKMLIQIKKDLLKSLSGFSEIDKIRNVLYCIREINMCLREVSE